MAQRAIIEGTLTENAQYRVYGGGTAVVWVLIQQPNADPVLVERAMGTSLSAHAAAANAAKHMRQGTAVVAHGTHLKRGRSQSRAVLKLEGVTLIEHNTSNRIPTEVAQAA